MRPVNLLPGQHRRTPTGGAKNGAYIVVGVLAVLLAMATFYTLTANGVNDRKTRAAEAKAEADTLEARAAQLNSYGNFAAVKEARFASVKQLAENRFDWERLLRELAAVLPEGSWLTEARASLSGDEAIQADSGPAAAAATPGAATQPTLGLTGCAPRQPDTAKLMVRLRQLYLVSDVELKESARTEASGPPSLESCGSFYKFDIVVTFSSAGATGDQTPPGRDSVPARLGGGS
jgi:Tfp pilus assembly protein PilN